MEAAGGTGVGIVRNMQQDTSLSRGFVVHYITDQRCTRGFKAYSKYIYQTIIDFQVVGDVFTSKANIS